NEGVYKYLSLRSDTQQIRLFFVEHVNELGNPVGRLRNFTHSSAPSYQALSYTWDAETPMYHFPITGTTNSKGRGLEVRKTLWEFLRAFGKTPLHQWIWIDQLCITQDDLAERNYQAQRMGDVYAEASEVL
ncbi:heterokaryon incompatibility protein-domain-containing protein, partial [Leptodontidium sp. 2 PMI_412]